MQNVVTNLGEVSRKGLAEGLRNFIQVDNLRALDVGHLREGLTSCKVRRPNGERGHPEVSVAWSRGTDTWKSFINVDQFAKGRLGPPWEDTDWHAFYQARCTKRHRRRRLERADNILGRNKIRLPLWEEHLKDLIEALNKALKSVEHSWWKVLAPAQC